MNSPCLVTRRAMIKLSGDFNSAAGASEDCEVVSRGSVLVENSFFLRRNTRVSIVCEITRKRLLIIGFFGLLQGVQEELAEWQGKFTLRSQVTCTMRLDGCTILHNIIRLPLNTLEKIS